MADSYPIHFEDVAASAGLTEPTIYGGTDRVIATSWRQRDAEAAFIDYDNDGWIDIFLVNGTTLDAGDSPQHSNRLLRNNRDGTFTDVTRQAGLTRYGWGQGVCVGDYDNDGYDDLFVTYWGQNVLYHNNGDGTFTDVTERSGLLTEGTTLGIGMRVS